MGRRQGLTGGQQRTPESKHQDRRGILQIQFLDWTLPWHLWLGSVRLRPGLTRPAALAYLNKRGATHVPTPMHCLPWFLSAHQPGQVPRHQPQRAHVRQQQAARHDTQVGQPPTATCLPPASSLIPCHVSLPRPHVCHDCARQAQCTPGLGHHYLLILQDMACLCPCAFAGSCPPG